MCQAFSPMKCIAENADAHDEPAKFRRERKMPAADFETEKAGDDGDHQNDASRDWLEPGV